MMKKSIGAVLIAALMMSFIPQQIFAAEDDGDSLTKVVTVNVAQNKPIKGGQWSDTYPITNLVDGMRSTFVVPEGTETDNENNEPSNQSNGWFMVDLQHRCKINSIELYDRSDAAMEGGRQNFKIYGALEENPAEWILLGGMDGRNDAVFPEKGVFKLELNGTDVYRYIKLERSGNGYYGYSEFKVFADQTVSEVSRGKDVSASVEEAGGYGTFFARYAVDGKNSDANECWVGKDVFNYLQIDLGEEQHIGYIEVEGRYNSYFDENYKDIGIYGTNTKETRQKAELGVDWKIEGGKRLAIAKSETDFEFPGAPSPKRYSSTVDDSQAYRYIIYKKESKTQAAVGEFRAFVVNPQVLLSSINGKTINLSFSDEMDLSTVNESTIRLMSANTGEEIPYALTSFDGYEFNLEMDDEVFGDVLNLEFSEDVKSTANVSVAAGIVELKAAPALEFKSVDFTDGANNVITTIQGAQQAGIRVNVKSNMSRETDVVDTVVVLALFNDKNSMVTANEIRKTILPQADETLSVNLDLSEYESLEGYRLSTFIWNDYRNMSPWLETKSIY